LENVISLSASISASRRPFNDGSCGLTYHARQAFWRDREREPLHETPQPEAGDDARLLVPRNRTSARRAKPGAACVPHRGGRFRNGEFLGPGRRCRCRLRQGASGDFKAAGDAAKAGGPVHIVFNLGKNATYRINRPLAFKDLHGFELNGNGAQLINTTRDRR